MSRPPRLVIDPALLLNAYASGWFPMAVEQEIHWFSPDPRGGILPLDALRVTKSLRQSAKRFVVQVDTWFERVIRACADPSREDGWITEDFVRAYVRLHELGWAHSVEAWDDEGLAGGLYGVAIAGLFAAESMFHKVTDASKIALVALVQQCRAAGIALLDVQMPSAHLASMGAVTVRRAEYLRRLAAVVDRPVNFTLTTSVPPVE